MKKMLWTLPLFFFASLAQAHVGHDHVSFMDGLVHPFGFDHLLAMVAVGLWSARMFTGKSRFIAPMVFVSSLVMGASLAHFTGGEFALAERLIAASVVAFGALLVFPQISKGLGFGLIIGAGWVHGWAHGVEATVGGVFALYVAGFVLTTAVLHIAGVLAGTRLLAARVWLWRAVGVAIGSYGALLLAGV
ncbi:MAG: hupE [Burkholderiaceae bacterium]|nr:hupE [Burkholderiaceae bacterium]